MSVVDKLKSAVGLEDESATKKRFRCNDCDNEFESFKQPRRASCMECMGNDVEVVERY